MAEQEGKPNSDKDELMALKIKCGDYAQKCVDLMADKQKKEAEWKERESIMVRRMEEAMKLIKNLKTRVDELEGQSQTGESKDNLEYKVKIAALQKQLKAKELDIKSLNANLDIKTVLESKKSRLVDLLDVKLQEKMKLLDLNQLKVNHLEAKLALGEARIAQLQRDKCEMALYLETTRQHMKKHGLEVGDPYEVKRAKERELKQKLEEGMKEIEKVNETRDTQSSTEKPVGNQLSENKEEKVEENVTVPKTQESKVGENTPEKSNTDSAVADTSEKAVEKSTPENQDAPQNSSDPTVGLTSNEIAEKQETQPLENSTTDSPPANIPKECGESTRDIQPPSSPEDTQPPSSDVSHEEKQSGVEPSDNTNSQNPNSNTPGTT